MTDASQDAMPSETPEATTETVEETTQAETQETESTEPVEAKADETEVSESGEDSAEKEEKERKRNSFQERINQKTREAKEAQARVSELEDRLRSFESQETQELAPRPKLEDFGYDEEKYAEALDDWTEQRSLLSARKARMEEQREEAQAQQARLQQLAVDTFKERSAQFEEEHPDYQEKLRSIPNSPILMQAALISDQGPQLAYYLGSNPDIANQLAVANPIIAAMELGKIQQKLSTPPPTQTTQAPPPAKPVGSSAKVEKDPDKMSAEEYAKFRGYRK